MAAWHGIVISEALSWLRSALLSASQTAPKGSVLPFSLLGNDDAKIRSREQELGNPLPDEVAELYRNVEGVDWGRQRAFFPSSTYLLPLEHAGWVDVDDYSAFLLAPTDWQEQRYCVFAKSVSGDLILWCERSPLAASGSIVLLDHECANKLLAPDGQHYTTIVQLADNLADWTARWATCGLRECAISFDHEDLPPAIRRDYLLDHIRLNPRMEWPLKALAEMDDAL